jgi:hypothetical protein
LWGQRLNVYTDHENLTRDGLGLTSNRVICWRILLEEYAPKIIYIKGIHNTVADAISQLDYHPKVNSANEYNHATHGLSTKEATSQRWLMFSKLWLCYNEAQKDSDKTNTIQLNDVFTNHSKDDEIYPLTVAEIVDAQNADTKLEEFFKPNATLDKGLELQIIEDQKCICNKGRLVIPKPLQQQTMIWYHHSLQHQGHTRLKETMNAAIYWKGMQTTIQSITKSCMSCQVNKRRTLKYGQLPSKIVISTPWEALCVDLVSPYTLKGKEGSAIDFMALTMINPASSWFKIVELKSHG